ncbi:MAG: hypothetical protein AAGA05_13605 [Pseudomonadota bacterium]
MKHVFASAAPKRLQAAVFPAARKVPAPAPEAVNLMRDTAKRVLDADEQVAWMTACPALADPDPIGRSLLDWECTEPPRKSEVEARPYTQSPARDLQTTKERPDPLWLSPLKTLPPKPEAADCAEAKAMPTRLSGGQLRLRARKDVEDLKPSGQTAQRAVPDVQKRPVRMPLPEAEAYNWERSRGRFTNASTETPRISVDPLPAGAAEAPKPAWASVLDGPKAPSALLMAAHSETPKPDRPQRRDLSARPAQDHPIETASDSKRKPVPARDSDPTGTRNHPIEMAGMSRSAQRASNSPEPPSWHREPVNNPDPLNTDTLSRPPHHTPVRLPPQPDLDPPFAENLPPEHRTRLGRFQDAVADEPLTELPARPHPPSPTAFDDDALGEALARVLRDEARRHGIDV